MTNQLAIAVGLLAGLALGIVADMTGNAALLAVAKGVSPIGDMFMNLVRMVVIPLVMTTLFTGVAGLPNARTLGKLGGATILFFWATTLVAILFGMVIMKGALVAFPIATQFAGETTSNPFEAAARGDLLQLVVFSLLFGAAAGTLPEKPRTSLLELSESLTGALIKLVHWVLWTAPLGVFALAAPMAASAGLELLKDLFVFVLAVGVALVLFTITVYVPAAVFLGKKAPGEFLSACLGPQVIGLSTTSSAAALPVMLEVAVDRLSVSKTVASMVLSVGTSINRAGSSLFQGAAVVFLGALYGVPIPLPAILAAFLALFLTSLTVAPVPSASVFTLAPALDAATIPLAGMNVILGIDRIPDMLRTAVNVTGHMATATVVEQISDRNDP
jgi:proton glutamate symport protein